MPELPRDFGQLAFKDPNSEDVTRLPDIAPNYTNTMGADVAMIEGQLKVARYRDFEFYCDEPPRLGGTDKYPQPLTYLAAGIGFWLLTQVARYASMLKKEVTGARCRVEFDLYLRGSVLQETNEAGVTQLRSHLWIESPEPPDVVQRIVRAAKRGCFAEQLVQHAVPLVSQVALNGEPLQT